LIFKYHDFEKNHIVKTKMQPNAVVLFPFSIPKRSATNDGLVSNRSVIWRPGPTGLRLFCKIILKLQSAIINYITPLMFAENDIRRKRCSPKYFCFFLQISASCYLLNSI